MRNKYCSNCLQTKRFLDLGDVLVCEKCSKKLHIQEPNYDVLTIQIRAFNRQWLPTQSL